MWVDSLISARLWRCARCPRSSGRRSEERSVSTSSRVSLAATKCRSRSTSDLTGLLLPPTMILITCFDACESAATVDLVTLSPGQLDRVSWRSARCPFSRSPTRSLAMVNGDTASNDALPTTSRTASRTKPVGEVAGRRMRMARTIRVDQESRNILDLARRSRRKCRCRTRPDRSGLRHSTNARRTVGKAASLPVHCRSAPAPPQAQRRADSYEKWNFELAGSRRRSTS